MGYGILIIKPIKLRVGKTKLRIIRGEETQQKP